MQRDVHLLPGEALPASIGPASSDFPALAMESIGLQNFARVHELGQLLSCSCWVENASPQSLLSLDISLVHCFASQRKIKGQMCIDHMCVCVCL